MKSNFLKSYFGKTVLNIIFSSIVFFIVTIFAIYNSIVYTQSKNTNLINQNYINEVFSGTFISIILAVALGIIAFAIAFTFLENKKNRYINYLYSTIKQMSDGDLSTEISVESDDELSGMAHNLNLMRIRLRKLIDNERDSEKTKNELITNIAHDLRTPLTSILGYLEILVNDKSLDNTKRDEYTHIAYEKSKKLEVLIEDLFSFTKMTYGKLAINVEKIDIVRLLYQLVDELFPLFEKENMTCEINTKINALLIVADPKLLVRLFENLINNAIKYGKDGKKIDINIEENEHTVDIKVINYGKLIPKDSIEKLFDKFYRVDKDRSSTTGGTGLGLAIAKSIVELHGGKILVTSDFRGTIFNVSLNK